VKLLQGHSFDAAKCRMEWNDYSLLLSSHSRLSERSHVLPFFKRRHDLSLFISSYFPTILAPDVLAHEFQIYGDFVADLVVGDSKAQQYLLVEFEDGAPDSIFKRKGKKATPDWSPRIQSAYSQLTDWFWKLEDMRSTADFASTFGDRRAKFHGLIVIGKGMALSSQEKDRLRWRSDRTIVDSNAVSCVSFEQLRDDTDFRLRTYHGS
jgi:hypothetical protein